MIRDAIQEDALKALVSQRAVREFLIRRHGEAWTFSVRLGVNWVPVRSRREPLRTWASLTAVGRYAEKLGVDKVLLEL